MTVTNQRRVSPVASIYIGLVIVAGLLVCAWGIYPWRSPNPVYFLCYLALAVPASCLKVSLPGVRFGTMSVLFVFLVAGVVELTLPETLVTGIVCVTAQSVWHSRFGARLVQVVFSIAVISLAIVATWYAYQFAPMRPGPFRLALAVTVFFLVNTLPIAVVIGLTEAKSIRDVWISSYWWCFPYYLAAITIVSNLIYSDRVVAWQAALMMLPVIYVVHDSYQGYLKKIRAERERTEAERDYARRVAALHEQTLKANAHVDALFRASPLAMVTLDENALINAWSPGAEQMFGWKAEEVMGKHFPFVNTLAEVTINTIGQRTLDGESIRGFEVELWRRDGSAFDASIWTAKLPGFEVKPSLLICIADVSPRKRLEDQLRLSHKMEAVGRLAGGIAHDFNNLLTVINGYSSLILPAVEKNPPINGYVEQVMAAGTRAAELVSQLLTFSRRQVIKPSPIEVNQLVRQLQRMLVRVIGEHIELRLQLDPEAGFIFADSNQMESALLNLATNARDAMRDGGTLTIATRKLDITGSNHPVDVDLPSGVWVRLSMRDTGCGIDEATKHRLFEPFYTTKERGRGTGLGLASVLGAVEQNNGRIAVSSEPGKGSEFAIYLPHSEPGPPLPAKGAPVTAQQCPKGTETILLVEDESSVRRLLGRALNQAGYRVLEAANGAEALNLWADSIDRIDLVVTDLVMPVMNGVRLIRELRSVRPQMRAICLSGHSRDVFNAEGDLPSDLDLMIKPLLPDVLVRKTREILDRPRGMDATRV